MHELKFKSHQCIHPNVSVKFQCIACIIVSPSVTKNALLFDCSSYVPKLSNKRAMYDVPYYRTPFKKILPTLLQYGLYKANMQLLLYLLYLNLWNIATFCYRANSSNIDNITEIVFNDNTSKIEIKENKRYSRFCRVSNNPLIIDIYPTYPLLNFYRKTHWW